MKARHYFLAFVFYLHIVTTAFVWSFAQSVFFTYWIKCLGLFLAIWGPLILFMFLNEIREERVAAQKGGAA